jgi:hypothetical protein
MAVWRMGGVAGRRTRDGDRKAEGGGEWSLGGWGAAAGRRTREGDQKAEGVGNGR